MASSHNENGGKMVRISSRMVRRPPMRHYHDVGAGHLYQGRFKSFPVAQDDHLLRVCRYVERKAARAGLVRRAERWR
jgi:hypothetical protein